MTVQLAFLDWAPNIQEEEEKEKQKTVDSSIASQLFDRRMAKCRLAFGACLYAMSEDVSGHGKLSVCGINNVPTMEIRECPLKTRT